MIGLNTDHDTVWLHEVVDRRALLQKLRIGAHVKGEPGVLVDRRRYLGRRAHGHRGLGDDHELAFHVLADLLRDGEHMPKISGAVLVGRRTHGDEDDVRGSNGRSDVRGEGQPALFLIALDVVVQTRLVDGKDIIPQSVDLLLIHIRADDCIACLGKAAPHNEPDIAGSDHRDIHVTGRSTR